MICHRNISYMFLFRPYTPVHRAISSFRYHARPDDHRTRDPLALDMRIAEDKFLWYARVQIVGVFHPRGYTSSAPGLLEIQTRDGRICATRPSQDRVHQKNRHALSLCRQDFQIRRKQSAFVRSSICPMFGIFDLPKNRINAGSCI